VDEVAALVHLEGVLHQQIETLSKGYKRRVGLAQALLHDPQVLILDEPTDGLDPNQKHEVRNLIRSMAKDKAIVLSTHVLEEVEAVCTRAIIINRGTLVFDDTPAELERRAPPEVTKNRMDWVFRSLTTSELQAAAS
jgi:ABC-2 type transport system ATP-binding protein